MSEPSQTMVAQLSLEEYRTLFRQRYDGEKRFRKLVHKHMRIKRSQAFKLDMARKFMHGTYLRMSQGIIDRYATEVYDGLQKLAVVNEQIAALERGSMQVSDLELKVAQASESEQEARLRVQQEEARKQAQIEQLRIESERELAQQQARYEQERQAATRTLDVNRIAQEQIMAHLRQTGQVVEDGDRIRYDDQAITRQLENRFLDEIVGEIESQTGGGFLAKSKSELASVLERWIDMNDYGQMIDVDWDSSVISARSQGVKYPSLPHHFVIPEFGPAAQLARTGLDTAITLDISGSMQDNGRFDAAKRMVLALTAYMHEMHASNKTYLSVFNADLNEVTNAQLYKSVRPDGGTYTHLGLDWLSEKLPKDRPSIGYLVTDGYPNYQGEAIAAAKRLREKRPNAMLRIFLIDPQLDSREYMRQIGEAAGRSTRFLTVDTRELGSGVIRDAADSISRMVNLDEL